MLDAEKNVQNSTPASEVSEQWAAFYENNGQSDYAKEFREPEHPEIKNHKTIDPKAVASELRDLFPNSEESDRWATFFENEDGEPQNASDTDTSASAAPQPAPTIGAQAPTANAAQDSRPAPTVEASEPAVEAQQPTAEAQAPTPESLDSRAYKIMKELSANIEKDRASKANQASQAAQAPAQAPAEQIEPDATQAESDGTFNPEEHGSINDRQWDEINARAQAEMDLAHKTVDEIRAELDDLQVKIDLLNLALAVFSKDGKRDALSAQDIQKITENSDYFKQLSTKPVHVLKSELNRYDQGIKMRRNTLSMRQKYQVQDNRTA